MSQQDAHEFLNYLLNTCADLLKAEMKELRELQRLEEQNRSETNIRLNTKSHRSLHKTLTHPSNPNQANGKANTPNSKRTNSANGSNRSLSSQNSSNSKSTDQQSHQNSNNSNVKEEELTWIHELFQGILVNETKCLNCETV